MWQACTQQRIEHVTRLLADQWQGHISRDCTAPNGGPLNSAGKACYKCGQPGHISRECTVNEPNGAMTMDTAVDPINQVQPSAPAAAAV